MEILGINFEELQFNNIGSWPLLPKRIFTGICCLITFGLGYLVDLSDKVALVESSTNRVVTLSGLFIDTHRQVSNLSSYYDEVGKINNQLKKLTDLLPSDDDESRVLEEISEKANESKVQFASIKPGKKENKGFYNEGYTQFVLTGSYNALGGFVSSISSMDRIITLHDFTISAGKNTRALTMEVLSKNYWEARGKNKK